MTQNPETGEGYDAVEVSREEFFDPYATDAAYPGVLGLQIRKKTFWQGDVQFDTFDTLTPVMGLPWPQGSIVVSGPGGTTALGKSVGDWGPNGEPPGTFTNPTSPGSEGGGIPDTSVATSIQPAAIVCDPTGIFGPLFGEDLNEIQILLEGVPKIGSLYFPVPPEEISADFPTDNDGDTDTLSGEIVIPGTERLESITLSSFFPRDYNSSYCVVAEDKMVNPSLAIEGLIDAKRFRVVMNLTVGGTPWNDQVIIKSLKWSAKAGEPGDIYYEIQFKRYRTASVSTVVLPDAPTDPRDYPSYQGPPKATAAAPVQGPQPQIFLNPATGNYEIIQGLDPNRGDGTQPDATVVAPGPGDPGFIGPLPVASAATPGVYITAPTTKKTTTVTVMTEYSVGAAFNWRGRDLISGQTLAKVYEDIKSKNSLNTLAALQELNKDTPATSTILGLGDFSSKHTVKDYNPYLDPLPLGTKIKYWSTRTVLDNGEVTPSKVAAAAVSP